MPALPTAHVANCKGGGVEAGCARETMACPGALHLVATEGYAVGRAGFLCGLQVGPLRVNRWTQGHRAEGHSPHLPNGVLRGPALSCHFQHQSTHSVALGH